MPANVATNQLLHLGQNIKSKHFRQYDHGTIGNYFKYKRSSPPDYDLKKVRIPIAVYYAESDPFINGHSTIPEMTKKLPNLVKTYLVPHKYFNHIDFVWGINATNLVHREILKTMKLSNIITDNNRKDSF